MGGSRAAFILALALTLPTAAASLTEHYGSCTGEAPLLTSCEFTATVGFVGGACTPSACVPGGFAIAGGAPEFTGILTARAQQLTGAGGGSSHATSAIVAGHGACEPDWSPRAWPMLAPGQWRVIVQVHQGEGAWWAAIDGLNPPAPGAP